MTRLILIRHGETEWNVIGRYQGQADPPLNEQGIAQSYQLADQLIESNLEILYTSPLQRAAQTAQILANKLRIPLYIEPRFMEIHQGDWQTRLRSEIEQLYPDLFRRWESEPWEVSPPHGESLSQVQDRVIDALAEIIDKFPNQCVGIVTHRIPIALIKIHNQGFDRDIVRSMQLPNIYYEEIFINSKGGEMTEGSNTIDIS
jgi:phosphoserine phosphatase